MSEYWPKPEPNPIKINPDGSQSPNPRYQGPNPYKKGADGKLTRIKNIKPVKPAAMGLFRNLGHLGTALSAGAGIGLWMKDNVGINTSGSGRGEGLSAFNPEKLTGTYGSLPASARVVTDYPKGIPTGLGGGNAAQAQSLDPEASAYIPPTRITTPDPTPVPVPTPEISSTSSSPDSQIPRMTFEDANKGLSDGITIQNPFADVYKSINFDASNSAPDAGDSVSGYSNNNGGFVVNPGEKSNDINDPSTWTDSYKLRRAFLDADDSLQGLRNIEALKGIKYAEGKHYRANEQAGNEGQSDFVPIDKSDYKKYKRGDLDAGSFVSELSPWSQQLVENLSTGNFTNPDNLKDLDIFKSDIEVPYNFDNVPTEVFSEKGLDLKYPGIFNSTYRPVI